MLVPDPTDNFITQGRSDSTSYVSSVIANDGSFALVYLPNQRRIDLGLTRLKGETITAQWYDPTNDTDGDPAKHLSMHTTI